MDVVLSKRLREVDEGEGQVKDCFVSFMGSNSLSQIDPSSLVICYGALNDAAAQCLANTIAPEELHLTNCNGYHRFPITFKDGTYLLQGRENESYAILDTHSTRKLAVLSDLCSVKLEAITNTSNLSKRRSKKKRCQTFSVFINIFGPHDVASDAASRLSKASAFLQHPKSLEPGIIYSNPQFFRVPGMDKDMNKYVGLGDRLSNQRKAMISAAIHDILCSLTRVESFQAGLPQGIQATLKPHQKDAFSYILQRETEAVCNNLQIGLQQVARVSNKTQSTSYGGIIADVMGLGKTLTMLTAILRSLPPACNFDKGDEIEMSTKTPTRATLVVVTSAQLIESWRTEIASIAFSYWTSTLDALGQLFNAAGVCHVQIDGRTSYTERSNRLNKFREDTRVMVLLMSIETGSVGLNLTAASVVHIVEPQWNPSVEEQAVARALRMGQTKEVKIFRYVMKGTVEENIIGLQKKKRKLATFTFGEDDEDAQEKLEDLKFVLSADIDQRTTTPGVTQ
ncbi:uncharacterized protein FTOL_08572 [Fusarium torulosum]|uniref:Helicase C-terminal domain-containing protein n=1 Tax=Fusarium torulosum TaxID=33205 RepID=A0AAE8MEK7_9HYPO|nr:uncharacterized protein FTOL_08572 [Fusarium torulosum]